MAARQPLTDADRQQILALHAKGMTRNDIARTVKRSQSTISRVVAGAGKSVDRTDTRAATEARKADLAEKRARLREKYLQRADELLEQMTQPCVVFNFGGKDNSYEEHTLTSAPSGDKRNLMQAAATALAKHEALVKMDQSMENHSAVDAWLEHITAGGTVDRPAAAGQEPPSTG